MGLSEPYLLSLILKDLGLSGLEPPTSRLSGVRSNRLSYKPFFYGFGSHLLSHTVSSAVLSASQVLTIVFGMGTGVSPGRIATEKLVLSEVLHELRTKLCSSFLVRSFRALVRRTSSFQNTHN